MTSLVRWLLDLVERLWLDRVRVRVIQRLLARPREQADAGAVFAADTTAIHKLPRRHPAVVRDEAGAWAIQIGAYSRLYVADGAPDALEGKPQALLVFGPLARSPLALLPAEGPILRDGRALLHPDPGLRDRTHVFRPALALTPSLPATPLMASLPPLGGGFVPTDVPVPPAGSPQPPAPAAGPASTCNPVYLFYGLCFQSPEVRPEEAPPEQIGDPLWPQTMLIGGNFAVRGYRKFEKCAGNDAGQAADFDALMQAFAADLAAQTQFCQCVDDQLVIYLAGHGYGSNPTGEVAIKFQPAEGQKEWVAWSKLLDRLAALITNPAKTYLIVDSCRSGLIFEPGRAPGTLRGLHVLTCTADPDTLGAWPHFRDAVAEAVGQLGAVNWKHFLELVKWKVSQWGQLQPLPGYPPYGTPRNGDLGGCRFQVEITSAAYGGVNIGGLWEYRFEIAGKTVDVAEHALAINTAEAVSLTVYDRLHEPCPSPPVNLVLRATATETTGENTIGRQQRPIQRSCDGTSTTLNLPVAVGQATMTFTVKVTTTC